VHAAVRPGAVTAGLPSAVVVHEVDLLDHDGLRALVSSTQPTQIHHLGGMSSVGRSWEEPVPRCRSPVSPPWSSSSQPWSFRSASDEQCTSSLRRAPRSSASPPSRPRRADPVRPVSPYGSAKALAHASVGVYRRRGLPASSLILYNRSPDGHPHSSPARSPKVWRGLCGKAREC
jgi:GDPmannose 4,6-dehydratase